ncbi:MAG: hypothetical protein JXA42_26155, partial [Anaerolineales bacterium]|nr:hypothetical protein [Anaerolineales bacterium]
HASAAELTNNAIFNNSGWAIDIEGASPRLINNTIASNNVGIRVAARLQDAVYYTSTVALINTILVNHSTGLQIEADNKVLVDSVLWYNTPNTITLEASSVLTVLNQYTGNPALDNDGYHIMPNSRALDAGVATGLSYDIDGHHRPYNQYTDLGADEIIATSIPSNTSSTLTYSNKQSSSTIINVPAEAVTESVLLAYSPVGAVTGTSSLVFAGHAFSLDAYRDGALLPDFTFENPVTITIHYTNSDVVGLDESILTLEYWNEELARWEDAACGPYERHPDVNWLAVPICHLSEFALFEKQTYFIFLPLVSNNQK